MSLHEDILEAVATAVRALNLPGLEPTCVYARATTDDANITYPAVLCTVAGSPEQGPAWDVGPTAPRYRWIYSVLVLALLRGHPRDHSKLAVHLEWRDSLMQGLNCKRFPGITDCLPSEVVPGGNITGTARARGEPGQTVDPLGPAWLKVAGSLVVNVPVIR